LFLGGIYAYQYYLAFVTITTFVVLIPLVSWFLFLILLGEYQRMRRLGKFLIGVEEFINLHFSTEVLIWELYLKKEKLHMRYPYFASLILLIFISFISQCLGVIMLDNSQISKITFGISIVIFHICFPSYIVNYLLKKV